MSDQAETVSPRASSGQALAALPKAALRPGARSDRESGVGQLAADEVIRNLIQWSEARADVRTVLLTSTRADHRMAADRFSDYDVVLAVDEIEPYYVDRSWLEAFGRVLVLYRDPIREENGCDQFAYITQYEEGIKIDFTLWPLELLRRIAAEPRLPDYLDVGYTVLLDKDGLADRLKPATHRAHIPPPPSEQAYLTLIEEFFHEATYVAKHLWRDDLLPAKYNLDQAMKQVDLRRMLEWSIEIEHDWAVKPGAYGKGLKRWVSPELWAELEATYTGAGIEENWEALFRTLDLFRRVAVRVGEELGFDYPHQLDQRAVAYLSRVRSPEGKAGFGY